jgi:hypothetical protein
MDSVSIANGEVWAGRGLALGDFSGAELYACPTSITIKASRLGVLEFTSQQVEQLSIVRGFLHITRGIRIHHLVLDYPRVVIFRPTRDPEEIIQGIFDQGFKCCGRDTIECIQCGAIIPDSESHCPKCGWTYEDNTLAQ